MIFFVSYKIEKDLLTSQNKLIQIHSLLYTSYFLEIFVLIMDDSKDQIQKCLHIIEHKLGWGKSTEWHSDVFIELSELIQKETNVLLSPITLKRVWGKVQYKNSPSISTLNTLSQFAGYSNWRDFKNKENDNTLSWIKKVISSHIAIITISAAIMTIAFISFYSMVDTKKDVNKISPASIKFSSRPIIEGLPNSVVFDFDLSTFESDSIYIQQYWDPTKTIKLARSQNQATGQYYYPGYFKAKLLVDGTIIKEHDLFIKTNGWLGTLDYTPIPKYIKNKVFSSDKLSFPTSVIDEIKNSKIPLLTSFHYVNDIPVISGDNFSLKTSIKNVYQDKWAICQKTSIVILGTKSAFIIPFSIPGCTSELKGMISEKNLNGKKSDLSTLGVDFSISKNIEIKVNDKLLTVYIDKSKVFSSKHKNSIGNIVGIRFRFVGVSEVTNTNLTDVLGKERELK